MSSKEPKSRTPLARMMRIHAELIKEGYPNCSTLARAVEVSTKTIQRDLEYMRDQMGLPVEYVSSRHGYCYSEPVTSFPTFAATEGELLALFVARQALEPYRGTPFERPLATAFGKLVKVMDDLISVDLVSLAGALSFRQTGTAVADLEVFQQVNRGLWDQRELEFSYLKLNGNRAELRRVQPYHLASIDGQWYLFAHDLSREDIRTFVLSRIRTVPVLGKPFDRPEDFSLSERLMHSFGVFSGTGNFRVRVHFDPFASQLVRERQWHPSQQIRERADGGLELEMRLSSLEEITRWILSWGGHAKVIGPPKLKQLVRDVLADMQDVYAELPPWFSELHEAAQAQQPDRLLQLVLSLDRASDAPGQLKLGFQAGD